MSDVRHRIAITKIRTCSHRLRSETGRWERPPILYTSRICKECNVLEDEYHVTRICTKYRDLPQNILNVFIILDHLCKSLFY